MTNTTTLTVATEILNQLGASKFLAMTGSFNLAGSEDALTMHLRNNKAKAKYLRIEITMNDTYNMIFRGKQDKKDYSFPIVAKYENVYADMLQNLFTEVTGLDTGL